MSGQNKELVLVDHSDEIIVDKDTYNGLLDTAGEVDALRAKVARYEEALPDPEKLDMLAEWFDARYPNDPYPEVQIDLRMWAKNARKALEVPK